VPQATLAWDRLRHIGGVYFGYVLGGTFISCPLLQFASRRKQITEPAAALGFVVLMTAGCVFSVLIAQIFVETPLVLVLILALLIFLAFLMLAKGQAVPVANTLLITVSVVPMVAVSSVELAYGLVFTLIAGSILAVF
jgi:hypothetical protein